MNYFYNAVNWLSTMNSQSLPMFLLLRTPLGRMLDGSASVISKFQRNNSTFETFIYTIMWKILSFFVVNVLNSYNSCFAAVHSCMPSPLAPDPIKVQSCVCYLFWTKRNSLAVTSIFLSISLSNQSYESFNRRYQ